MGPHLAHHLAGGRAGLRHLLEHIGPGIERWWNDLGRPDLTPAVIDRLVAAFGASRAAADRRSSRPSATRLLLALLETLAGRPRSALAGRRAGESAR